MAHFGDHAGGPQGSGPSASPSVWDSLHGILGDAPRDASSAASPAAAQHHADYYQQDHHHHLQASADPSSYESSWGVRTAPDPHSSTATASKPAAPADDDDEVWKSFMQKRLQAEEEEKDGLVAGETFALRPKRVGTARSKKSLVEELEEQTAADQMRPARAPETADLTKQPKKSALKGGGGRLGGGVTYVDGHQASTPGGKGDKGGTKNLADMFRIIMPNLSTNGWDALVHQVVWKVGRHFGFQAFNVNPRTKELAVQEHVPSTIFIAGDHLATLLCKQAYIRRPEGGEPDEERFAKALAELHATIFHTYEHYWCTLVGLPWRTSVAQQVLLEYSYCDPRVMHGLLCELALWFLIYTESSSMRHTPELMWFIYWCMTTSFVMADFWHRELPQIEPNMRDRRVELRNLHQKLITEVQAQLQIYPRRTRPEDCGRVSTIVTRLQDTEVPDEDFQLLGDLIAFGDGGFYCDRIVTPIFDVFAYEVDHLSNLGVDVAHRLGYDDFNESMCCRPIVQDTLRELRVKPEQIRMATQNDAYVSLTNLGFGKGAAMSTFEAGVASEFWHTKVFVKTYRERRTWAAVYRAYFRVWCFHLVAYQFLQVLAFTGWDWRSLSSCIVTHVVLKAFERFCNWFMTNEPAEPLNTTLSKVFTTKGRYRMSQAGLRAIARMNKITQTDTFVARNVTEFNSGGVLHVNRRKHEVEGRPPGGLLGFVEWVLLAMVVTGWYIAQFYQWAYRPQLRMWWPVFAGSWVGVHLIHWVLTVRDGYMVSLTHMLRMPSILKASSSRPDAECWLSAPMHMKWKLFWTNALFWGVVLAMKLPFDYFVLAKPVVQPLIIVNQRNYLQCQGRWYLTVQSGDREIGVLPCIGGDWLLMAGRICPFIVIVFMDTSLFYQITITIFGIIRGLFKLDLGVLTSWDEVVKEFYRAPARWWHKCMSEMGNDNQLNQLKQSMFIEDAATGGHVQVTDGLMFKKTVLTPEEIHGKKVHFNGRRGASGAGGGGGNSESGAMATKRADSVVDSMGQNLLGRMLGGGGSAKPKGGALLPSSTNRTKASAAGQDFAARKKKEDERLKEQQAKLAAKRAAIAAGLDRTDASVTAGSESKNAAAMQRLMSRRDGATTPAPPGEDDEPSPQPQATGVKSMLNKLLSTRPASASVDAVDKLTQDAKRSAQMRKLMSTKSGAGGPSGAGGGPGLTGAPSMKKVELQVAQAAKPKPSIIHEEGDDEEGEGGEVGDAGSSRPGSEAPKKPTGVMGRLTTLLRGGGGGGGGPESAASEDDVDKMARGARLAARSVKEARPSGIKAVTLPTTQSSAGSSSGGGVNVAASPSGRKKKSGGRGVKFTDEEEAPAPPPPPPPPPPADDDDQPEDEDAFFSHRPATAKHLRAPSAVEVPPPPPADQLPLADGSYSPSVAPRGPGGPVAEATEDEDEDEDESDAGRGARWVPLASSNSVVRAPPEITADSEVESSGPSGVSALPLARSGNLSGVPWARAGSSGARRQQQARGPGPVAEGADTSGDEEDAESEGTEGEQQVQAVGSSWWEPADRTGHLQAPQVASSSSTSQGKRTRRRKGELPAQPAFRHVSRAGASFMPFDGLGPAAAWWGTVGVSQQPDESAWLAAARGGHHGEEDEDESRASSSGSPHHERDSVSMTILPSGRLVAASRTGHRSAKGPVAEGAQSDLASWLTGGGGNGDSPDAPIGGGSGTGVVPLPPIRSAHPSQAGAFDPEGKFSPLGRNPARPLETELDEVFGRPIESRPGSGSGALGHSSGVASLPPIHHPHAIPPSRGPTQPNGDETPTSYKAMFNDDQSLLDTGTPVSARAPLRSAMAKKERKAARFADAKDDAEDPLSDFERLLNQTASTMSPPKDGGAAGGKKGGAEPDNEPLLGRFMSKFNMWKKKDQQGVSPAKSASSALELPSLKVLTKALPAQDSTTPGAPSPGGPGGGLTAEDLEIDDVHYQMMMWNAFANAWDEVVDDVRMSDLISDKEVGMLKFVRLDLGSRLYGLRPILLPTFFYAGQVRKVVDTGQVSTAQIMVLNELRVLSVWLGCQIGLLSGKHAHVITSAPFFSSNINVKHALHRKKFYTAGVKLIELLEDMCSRQEVPFDMREFAEHLFTIFTSIEAECFAICKAHQRKRCTDDEFELSTILLEVVQEMKSEISKDADRLKVIFKNALSTSATANFKELLRVVRVIKRMLIATVAEATPTGEEAQRALGFFINSLSHPSLDRPTSLDKMWSWSILTPLYEEDVLYPLEGATLAKEMGLKKKKLTDLLTEGDDSISLMSYLKSTFPNEWNNFKERMKTQVPDIDVKELSELDFAPNQWLYDYRMELQLWASCRGQLLGRTVSGMMRNEKALRVLAKLEHPRPPDMSDLAYHRWIDKLVTSKFEMVITPQTYGKNRDSKDVRLKWLSKSIDLLLQRYPKCLKAAFLEKADMEGMGITEFSVCIKGRDPEDLNQLPHLEDQPVYEVYRVRLPQNKYSVRGVILGEGKPENQNHATIFAHHEGIQAIDMNQDGYLCEWLKFRNLLAELQPSSRGDFYLFANDDEEHILNAELTGAEVMSIVRKRMSGCVQTALVGFREYIFSEAAGALGRFAAATEYAFGTISQRTMTHPARVRLHYGHPDLFNKLFVMTKGGISKATRLLHLTEDVFCGCNHTLRGARIRYKEYISCGKGRDMGFDSINGFNFKIAGGGGEWAISRESFRMGTRLDFFRLFAFYHAAVGFYINSWFTYLAVYLNVYALLLFAWAEATEIQADNVQRVYNVQQVLQLGTLALIPYAGQLMLENGIIKTTITLFQQIATGSLLFYTFQQQTVAASFSTDMTYGSGKYVGTGRGFNIQSLEFVKIFTLYARSHLYMGFELLFALSTLYIVRDCADCNYGALTWSSWLLACTLLFAPLWFNPFSFDMQKVSGNYLSWRRWMDGDVDYTTGSNWYTWNTVQLEKIRNDGGNNTDEWLNIMGAFLSTAPYVFMALGSASRIDICLDKFGWYDPKTGTYSPMCNRYVVFLIATAAIWLLTYVTIVLRQRWLDLANHKSWRIYTWLVSLALIVFTIGFLVGLQRILQGSAIGVLFIVLYANFNILIAFHKVVTPWFSQNNTMRAFSDWFFYSVDSLIGYIMFILMALLSFIGIVGVLQMKLLFNDTFSEQVKHAKIGRAMKEQKVGFDASRGAAPLGPPGSAMQRPGTGHSAASGATAFTMRSMVQSEHRYM